MSNLTMITDLLGHAYLLDNASPDEHHLKVGELIAKLVERDSVLVDALKEVLDKSLFMSDPYSRELSKLSYNALKSLGEDV